MLWFIDYAEVNFIRGGAPTGASWADATARASLWKRKHGAVFGGIAAKNRSMFSLARLCPTQMYNRGEHQSLWDHAYQPGKGGSR
jgi:hypothetical protein